MKLARKCSFAVICWFVALGTSTQANEIVVSGPAIAQKIVRRLVNGRLRPIKNCYYASESFRQKRKGRIIVTWEFEELGEAYGFEYLRERSTLKDPSLANCIWKQVRGLKFPALENTQTMSVTSTFDFKP